MTPVPGDAGRNKTRPPPNSPIVSCGIVFSCSETFSIDFARRLRRFANRFRNFVRLAESDADFAIVIAGHDQRAEAKTPTTFYDLRAAIDEHDFLGRVPSRRGTLVRVAICASSIAAVLLCHEIFLKF